LLKQLHDNAEKTLKSARMHMSREETDVLPALRQHLSTDEKFTLVRHSLQTLPLRLLERIVPWLAQQVGPAGLSVLVQANAPVDTLLVQLIGKWAQRAFAGGGIDNGADMHSAFPATTCMPQVVVLAKARLLKSDRSVIPVSEAESRSCQHPSSSSADEATNQRAAKRPRSVSPTPAPAAAAAANPVDHIFQFHKALRQELHNIEQEARLLQRMVACASPSSSPRGLNGHAAGSPRVQPADAAAADHVFTRVRLLEGRLRFLEGIYKAHSESEDEVVFPALEAKQTLQNVSTFYTMDHQEEAKLFAELRSIMDEVCGRLPPAVLASSRHASAAWSATRVDMRLQHKTFAAGLFATAS
jgi:zinc finger-like protein